jgi:hypothetical protein
LALKNLPIKLPGISPPVNASMRGVLAIHFVNVISERSDQLTESSHINVFGENRQRLA